MRNDGNAGVDPAAFEAGAYDPIRIGGRTAVPAPGAAALLLLGLGALAGTAIRRRA